MLHIKRDSGAIGDVQSSRKSAGVDNTSINHSDSEPDEGHLLVPNWEQLEEGECERVLESSPFNNYVRLRLAQIWIEEERNAEDALKLI